MNNISEDITITRNRKNSENSYRMINIVLKVNNHNSTSLMINLSILYNIGDLKFFKQMAPKKSTSTKKTESNDLFGILSEEDLNK